MEEARFYLFPGWKSSDGRPPLMMELRRGDRSIHCQTGLHICAEHWREKEARVDPAHPNALFYNLKLLFRKSALRKLGKRIESYQSDWMCKSLDLLFHEDGAALMAEELETSRRFFARRGIPKNSHMGDLLTTLEWIHEEFVRLTMPMTDLPLEQTENAVPSPEKEPVPPQATPKTEEPMQVEQVRALIEEHGSDLVIVVRAGENDGDSPNESGVSAVPGKGNSASENAAKVKRGAWADAVARVAGTAPIACGVWSESGAACPSLIPIRGGRGPPG